MVGAGGGVPRVGSAAARPATPLTARPLAGCGNTLRHQQPRIFGRPPGAPRISYLLRFQEEEGCNSEAEVGRVRGRGPGALNGSCQATPSGLPPSGPPCSLPPSRGRPSCPLARSAPLLCVLNRSI